MAGRTGVLVTGVCQEWFERRNSASSNSSPASQPPRLEQFFSGTGERYRRQMRLAITDRNISHNWGIVRRECRLCEVYWLGARFRLDYARLVIVRVCGLCLIRPISGRNVRDMAKPVIALIAPVADGAAGQICRARVQILTPIRGLKYQASIRRSRRELPVGRYSSGLKPLLFFGNSGCVVRCISVGSCCGIHSPAVTLLPAYCRLEPTRGHIVERCSRLGRAHGCASARVDTAWCVVDAREHLFPRTRTSCTTETDRARRW